MRRSTARPVDEHRRVDARSCVCGKTFTNDRSLTLHVTRIRPINHGSGHAYDKRRCRCDVCSAANRERKRVWAQNLVPADATLRERDERIWNSRVAAEYGCTVTFESESGQTLTLSRRGHPIAAFKALCADALAQDATYRLVGYSTPQTIRTDLDGARIEHFGAGGERRGQPTPEAIIASHSDLLPVVHPRLRGAQLDHQERDEEAHYRGWDARLLASEATS